MIQIIAGGKGEGKTKRMIQMANTASKEANGNIVFIDDDNRNMYDLHYGIRFIETEDFIIKDQKIFLGFICGILSQDRDIEKIYIDGFKNMGNEDILKLINEIEIISNKENVDFVLIISCDVASLPEEIKKYLI